MAGEWIKFECSLPEKPEVMAVTTALGWDDPDLTVGKLMRLFRWFDQQTLDGNALGVTPALLDRLIGVTGFVQALQDVRWIEPIKGGLSLCNFGKHNGETAKARAQTAKRVANHRSNAPTVTPPLAREEKRREDKREVIGDAKRRKQLPKEFYPDETGVSAIEQTGLSLAVELSKFCDHHMAKGSVMLDWQAAWRTWVSNAVKFAPRGTATELAGPAAWYDTKGGVARKAAQLGIASWNQIEEQWPDYRARVMRAAKEKQPSTGLNLDQLAKMATERAAA